MSQIKSEDAEVDRILSMTNEEIMAIATPEDIQGAEELDKRIKSLLRVWDAGFNEGLRKASDYVVAEGEFMHGIAKEILELKK